MEKRRILCVEGEPLVCGLVAVILENYDVVCTNSIDKVRTLCEERPFDLYLIDPNLRQGDGMELVNWIRNFDPEKPILFLAGSDAEGESISSTDFVRKSSRAFVDELREKVAAMLKI